jgi:hypothetical protein
MGMTYYRSTETVYVLCSGVGLLFKTRDQFVQLFQGTVAPLAAADGNVVWVFTSPWVIVNVLLASCSISSSVVSHFHIPTTICLGNFRTTTISVSSHVVESLDSAPQPFYCSRTIKRAMESR